MIVPPLTKNYAGLTPGVHSLTENVVCSLHTVMPFHGTNIEQSFQSCFTRRLYNSKEMGNNMFINKDVCPVRLELATLKFLEQT